MGETRTSIILILGSCLQGMGEAACESPSLSWRGDGFVYGGTGSARPSAAAARGCNTQIRVIDEVLQPCCKTLADLLGGESGLAARAPADSIQAKAYNFLLSKIQVRMSAGYALIEGKKC